WASPVARARGGRRVRDPAAAGDLQDRPERSEALHHGRPDLPRRRALNGSRGGELPVSRVPGGGGRCYVLTPGTCPPPPFYTGGEGAPWRQWSGSLDSSRSVLITGGAGFLGCHLARRFLQEDYQVTLLDVADLDAGDLLGRVRFVRADVRDRRSVME